MKTDEDLVNRYLLGSLADADREAVESRMFSDEMFFDLVEFAEDELIEAYSRRRLSSNDVTRFEQYFLQSQRRRDRVAVALSLRNHFENVPRPSPTAPLWAKRFHAILDAFGPVRILAVAACALAVVLASLAGILALQLHTERDVLANLRRDSQYQLQQLRDRLATQAASPGATRNSPVTVAFVLAPGILRGGHERTIAIPPAASSVTLTLQTTFALSSGSYKLALTVPGGKPIWETEFAWPAGAPAEEPLAAAIPTSRLAAGRYLLTLSAHRSNGDEPLTDYAFVVQNR